MPPTLEPPAPPVTPAKTENSVELRPTPVLKSAFDELDAYDDAAPIPPKPDAPAPEPPAAKPEDQAKKAVKPAEPAEKPEAKAPDKPAAKPPEPPIEKMAPKELRQAYESLRAKHSDLEKRHSETDAEFQKLKNAPKPEDPEKKTLADQLASERKRRTELEDQVKATSYERSAEYKEKYYQPFVDAWEAGRTKAALLKITSEDGAVRQGTTQDFDQIVAIQDDDAAADAAFGLYGNKANIVLYHRERIHELNRLATRALESGRKTYADKLKQDEERAGTLKKEIETSFQQYTGEDADKHPQFFKPSETDKEESELLAKGYALTDAAFRNDPHNPALTPEQREKVIRAAVAVRHRSAAFGRVVAMLKKAEARAEAAEKELADIKASAPRKGDGRADEGKDKRETSWEEDFDAMDKNG